MSKIINSTVAIIALSANVMAGGDIAPVEPAVSTPDVSSMISPSAAFGADFYVGAAYTMPFATELSATGSNSVEHGTSTGMLVAGAAFNDYFGVEARWTPMTGTNDNFALYAKPEWKINNEWNIYGLVGAGKTEGQKIELQAGAGLGYEINENWGLFADFVATDFKTELASGSTDTGFSGNASFGFNYTF